MNIEKELLEDVDFNEILNEVKESSKLMKNILC
jgi:hypothetical protein